MVFSFVIHIFILNCSIQMSNLKIYFIAMRVKERVSSLGFIKHVNIVTIIAMVTLCL